MRQKFGNTEVDDFANVAFAVLLSQKYITRFQISVYDALFVRVSESRCELQENVQRAVYRQIPLLLDQG